MKEINEIIAKYTAGQATVEETNAALEKIGSDLRLDENKNTFTAKEIMETKAGKTATEANGYGLIDMGLGTPTKVEVRNGELVHDDMGSMTAYCIIKGKTYKVDGKKLVD